MLNFVVKFRVQQPAGQALACWASWDHDADVQRLLDRLDILDRASPATRVDVSNSYQVRHVLDVVGWSGGVARPKVL